MRAETRAVLPVVALSATALLAIDLILPALPALREELGASLPEVQGVVSAFLAAVAVSQLLWGELVARLGVRRAAWIGMGTVAVTSAGCALADDLTTLVLLRAVQGAAAGVATVVAPTIVRQLLPERQRTAGLSILATFESLAPAAGPVLGAALLPLLGWRGLFWLIAVLAVLAPVAARRRLLRVDAMPAPEPTQAASGWLALLADRRYLRLSLAHATSLGGLIGFVTCAPHLVVDTLQQPLAAFATLQVAGVAAFIVGALATARHAATWDAGRVVPAAALGQLLVFAALTLTALADTLSLAVVVAAWVVFCGCMGLRGPATVAASLALPADQVPRAAALTMVLTLLTGALLAQAGAWLLESRGPAALLAMIAAVLLPSVACVWPFPRHASVQPAPNSSL